MAHEALVEARLQRLAELESEAAALRTEAETLRPRVAVRAERLKMLREEDLTLAEQEKELQRAYITATADVDALVSARDEILTSGALDPRRDEQNRIKDHIQRSVADAKAEMRELEILGGAPWVTKAAADARAAAAENAEIASQFSASVRNTRSQYLLSLENDTSHELERQRVQQSVGALRAAVAAGRAELAALEAGGRPNPPGPTDHDAETSGSVR
eukprot:TRINITY_DN67597_c0_g1_i1.p1 TRINITY_DN67597_c0_g1~~TRINITY_DN67597_c0_g1_i1.p1  ORF type:complete len:217 (-),score=20.67 TRINITY_DN67597_c0_g1_i1:1440-2090(-)